MSNSTFKDKSFSVRIGIVIESRKSINGLREMFITRIIWQKKQYTVRCRNEKELATAFYCAQRQLYLKIYEKLTQETNTHFVLPQNPFVEISLDSEKYIFAAKMRMPEIKNLKMNPKDIANKYIEQFRSLTWDGRNINK
jgi:hypothetical protein